MNAPISAVSTGSNNGTVTQSPSFSATATAANNNSTTQGTTQGITQGITQNLLNQAARPSQMKSAP